MFGLGLFDRTKSQAKFQFVAEGRCLRVWSSQLDAHVLEQKKQLKMRTPHCVNVWRNVRKSTEAMTRPISRQTKHTLGNMSEDEQTPIPTQHQQRQNSRIYPYNKRFSLLPTCSTAYLSVGWTRNGQNFPFYFIFIPVGISDTSSPASVAGGRSVLPPIACRRQVSAAVATLVLVHHDGLVRMIGFEAGEIGEGDTFAHHVTSCHQGG